MSRGRPKAERELQVDENLYSLRRLEELLGRERSDILRIAESAGRYYKPFDRRKERGKGPWRHIDNPTGELRHLQSRIQRRILANYPFPEKMVGGVRRRSVVDAAKTHVGASALVTLDLRSCFAKTSDLRVFSAYRQRLGCSAEVAGILTQLTTVQHRLPQGAPSSLSLANLTLIPMYNDLDRLAESYDLKWALFVDDIGFSGSRALEAIESIIRIVGRHGHSVRRRKIHRMNQSVSEKLLGTVVNRKVSAGRPRIQRVRAAIYELSTAESPPDWKLQSVWGQVIQIKSLSLVQGATLERLAIRFLPVGGTTTKRTRTDETIACNSTRKHKYS